MRESGSSRMREGERDRSKRVRENGERFTKRVKGNERKVEKEWEIEKLEGCRE